MIQVSDASKVILSEFRDKHKISVAEHVEMLAKFGWTKDDYNAGFKG